MIVSVEELKAHLRIQQDAEDALLERLLHQAQAAANDFCRTDFDADAPEPVRLAVLLMASHFYEDRDASDRSAYQKLGLSSEIKRVLEPALQRSIERDRRRHR